MKAAGHAGGGAASSLQVEWVPTVHATDFRVAERVQEAGFLHWAGGAVPLRAVDGFADGWVGGPVVGVRLPAADCGTARAFFDEVQWCDGWVDNSPAATGHNLRLSAQEQIVNLIDGKQQQCSGVSHG